MKDETKAKWLSTANNLAYRMSNTKRSKANKVFCWVLVVFLIIWFAGMVSIKVFGVRYNFTNSMKTGFYTMDHKEAYQLGDTVEVCLPNKFANLGFKRSYLMSGSCPDGIQPLVKEIIGVPGDVIDVTHKGMTVNGTFYDAPQHSKDSKGRPLETFEAHNLKIKGYLVYGKNDYQLSWDSRYYGVLPSSSIVSVMSYAQ
jgi:conjugative transfer signal peptidase TraF|tara:strand:- start:27069 stop:27665 length:597 start_codon:yes stop_codon:yes gene_type:complete